MAKHDPNRPGYHFLPAANWMNDPNGLIQWKGRYHLFYQYNPHGAFHSTMHWGHAVSDDLVRWNHLPIALTPDPGGPDSAGCWSGCAVDNGGVPTILYTGYKPQVQCLAWGDDELLTWKKHPANPVIAAPPTELDIVGPAPYYEWRDPFVWRDERGSWLMLVGTGIRGIGGAALLYRSDDLVDWQYLHPLLDNRGLGLGDVWECPSLVAFDGGHVLLLSPVPESRHTYYLSGAVNDLRFEPELTGKTDHGPFFYAAQPMRDDRGRVLLWGWIKEGRSDAAQRAAGWSGVMSLPRVLSLRPDGLLGMAPAPELVALRGRGERLTDLTLSDDSRNLLPDWAGRSLEIVAEFAPLDAGVFGLRLLCSPDGSEQTVLGYDTGRGELFLDARASSPAPDKAGDRVGEVYRAPLRLGPNETLRLQVFVDGSVIEVFANGHVCLTGRVYPTRPDSSGVDLFAARGRAHLRSLEIWELGSIWDNQN